MLRLCIYWQVRWIAFLIWWWNSLNVKSEIVVSWNWFFCITWVCLEKMWCFWWLFLCSLGFWWSSVEGWYTFKIDLLNGNAVKFRCFIKVFIFSFGLDFVESIVVLLTDFNDAFLFWKIDMFAIRAFIINSWLRNLRTKHIRFPWQLWGCFLNTCRSVSDLLDSTIGSKAIAFVPERSVFFNGFHEFLFHLFLLNLW